MSYEFIKVERRDRVGLITLNRPKQLNALNPPLMQELGKALREFDAAASLADAKRKLLQAIDAVAGVLGNTRAVCRKSYINPAVFIAWQNGELRRPAGRGKAGGAAAKTLLALLRRAHS